MTALSMGNMLQLINRFVDICLLRRGPQALPVSVTLTTVLIGGYFLLIAAAKALLDSPDQAMTWGLLATVLLATTVYLMLWIRGVTGRIFQTLSALAGCGILYLLIYLPLSAILVGDAEQALPQALSSLLFFCWVVVFFWGFIIEGHIYRHALSISLPAGVLISVLLFAVVSALYDALFGVAR